MRIDAHQHFWDPKRGDYGWLTPDLTSLYRIFGPNDLAPEIARHDVQGTVLVQAAPTSEETDYILSLADRADFVLGVVGWVDFEADDAAVQIASLADHPKLVGLRPMIQDIDDVDWMLGDKLAPAFEAMVSNDLAFDALTLPKHLPNLLELCARYPALRVVIDHASKPEIADGRFAFWAAKMKTLANETTACVKLSGLVTEAGNDWDVEDLSPYVDHLVTHFGPDRIIWGSDWPVCTLASDYSRWFMATELLLTDLTPEEQSLILGGNAARIYKLEGTI